MCAIDTNVIVRFLTADDAAPAAAAHRIIEAGDIFCSTTVLLETEWVLRSGNGFSSEAIGAALAGPAGLPGVAIDEPFILAAALDGLARGIDFADALHVAKAEKGPGRMSCRGLLCAWTSRSSRSLSKSLCARSLGFAFRGSRLCERQRGIAPFRHSAKIPPHQIWLHVEGIGRIRTRITRKPLLSLCFSEKCGSVWKLPDPWMVAEEGLKI